MRILKNFYLHRRNGTDGIFYAELKDKLTGKKLTAKSTRTRDRKEAEAIAAEWYYNPESDFNSKQKQHAQEQFKQYLQSSLLSEDDMKNIFTEVFGSMAITTAQSYAYTMPQKKSNTKRTAKYPEIQEVLEKIDTLTFKEYLFLFFNYEKSPYIKQLKRTGKKQPYPLRFNRILGAFKYYETLIPTTLLTEIEVDEIDDFLTGMKVQGRLKDSSIGQARTAIVQALRFAHTNGIMARLISGDMIKKFSRKNAEKEIFTKEEYTKMFETGINYFKQENYLLINKLLMQTGCRIGEILALQIADIVPVKDGYALHIDKSYNDKMKLLKCTKTERKDLVPISKAMAQELFNYIKTNPYKEEQDAFIFYSKVKEEPLSYSTVYDNFNKTMKQLGIKRENLSLHSYRHTFTCILRDAGFSEMELMMLTRHDDITQITKRYGNHVTPLQEEKKRKAMQIVVQQFSAA